ncbi:MAG: MetQ/NlpA family ABC transporter substrate-binding protein [Coriobacteriia bacterium]|nr:MetQ/NlpA family ABC transporter substrate-binding protein [Coriobacteriia bacterium]
MNDKASRPHSQTLRKVLVRGLSAMLAGLLLFGLSACGSNNASNGETEELVKVTVGASVTPHAEILANLVDDMEELGFELVIVEYTDYVKPNLDTDSGDLDANFFQHKPYLDEFNLMHETDLVSVAAVHFEPLAIYPGQSASLDELPDGAKIAIPNDTTNEARALHLIAAQGLITLPADAGFDITPIDIVDNPKNLQFIELEAAAVPRQLDDVDLAVVNGNYALAADLDFTTVLATEDPTSDAAITYANILVVASGNESDPGIVALVDLLQSEKTRDFIETNYPGVVIPVF